MNRSPRFHPSAGIAIGPILFILALLAVIAAVMASGSDGFQTASGADRITADIVAQANLIRNTINDCNMQYTLDVSMNSVNFNADPYPTSAATGTAVSALGCAPTGDASIWNTATSNILMPPPTQGFNVWMYIDASATGGGRCFWTSPTTPNAPIVEGLTRAASKFNSATVYSATNEVLYDPSLTNNPYQKFVVWITMPTSTPSSYCSFP
jgi:hypothetical protein